VGNAKTPLPIVNIDTFIPLPNGLSNPAYLKNTGDCYTSSITIPNVMFYRSDILLSGELSVPEKGNKTITTCIWISYTKKRLFVPLIKMSVTEQKVKSEVAYKLVIDDPMNKPDRICFIIGIVECSFNFCHHQSDIVVCLGFEGFDSMKKLFCYITTRKPKRMLCQKSNN
jgi:hypothetical protein